jgi:hypothetical protein
VKPGDPDYPPILPSNIRRAFHAYLTGRLTYAQYLRQVMPEPDKTAEEPADE